MSYDSGSNYKYPEQDKNKKVEPVRQVPKDEWALRDIDLITDDANFGDTEKIKQIKTVLQKYFNQGQSLPESQESKRGEGEDVFSELIMDVWAGEHPDKLKSKYLITKK